MKINTLAIGLIFLALAGCDVAQDSTSNIADTMGTETGNTWNKMRDVFGIGHPKPDNRPKPQPRYCYRTSGDVICYERPIPGQEYRLTGYQDSKGHTGYVLPPNYETDDPAKKKTVKVVTTTTTTTGAPPLASRTFIGPTPPVAGVGPALPDKKLKEVIFDPAELQPKELVPEKTE